MKHFRRTAAVLAALALVVGGASVAQAEPATVNIDAGGPGDATFAPDSFGTGGLVDTKPAAAPSLANWRAAHPIPTELWHTSRYLESSYVVPGLTPGATYEVRLYFMDWYFKGKSGMRIFDVAIDGTKVLTDFDIIATAKALGADGGNNFGLEKDFTAVVGESGTVTIDFIRGKEDQPQVNAIALVPVTP
ncbi:malectin domain-containing carbohydrate-binding protein [Umezawaea sp. Da 62-37]|uniref:malectin domain-containing carbohydrate-binding protein n=1 Tax=Umezawaea sp. Da 62-37 TaxID=3075927 RepID=UPI0028F6E873|nr:malectin domain-containing carbohydrate-binding protein [Umezawaea sp. Da 62-37]WNV88801.1 malectin domain-containing carbohydrate-binding protein [Umezawaea sp. Da 62-37]